MTTKRENDSWTPPIFIKVRVSPTFFRCQDMTPEEWHKHTLQTLKGCMTGTREEGSCADAYLEEWTMRQEQARNAGRASAGARRGKSISTGVQRTFNGRSTKRKEEEKTRGEKKTEEQSDESHPAPGDVSPADGVTDGVSVSVQKPFLSSVSETPQRGTPAVWQVADDGTRVESRTLADALPRFGDKMGPLERRSMAEGPQETVRTCPAQDLPDKMAIYCNEATNQKALNAYKKTIREHGAAPFREVACAFIAEVEAGEEPANRGAAFTARLRKAGLL